jgi:predicted nucleotidyltransferase component of viral defense system
MTGRGVNIAASVATRLLNLAKATGDDYQTLLTNFCFERFLYRLGVSDVSKRFILKGAMLLRVWSDHPYRATRDLDLLRRGDASFDAIQGDIRTVCETTVSPDGVEYEVGSVAVEAIRADDEYVGARAVLPARRGSARLLLQIDMGSGDAVWPAATRCIYPTLLEFAAPEILVYPREAVVAEKFEAMVAFGDRNSRIKDFFDLYFLAEESEFERATLAESIRRTFARRQTPIPQDEPMALTPAYWSNPSRPAQVRAFARRAGLDLPAVPEETLLEVLTSFINPILGDLRSGQQNDGVWKPGGPWS